MSSKIVPTVFVSRHLQHTTVSTLTMQEQRTYSTYTPSTFCSIEAPKQNKKISRWEIDSIQLILRSIAIKRIVKAVEGIKCLVHVPYHTHRSRIHDFKKKKKKRHFLQTVLLHLFRLISYNAVLDKDLMTAQKQTLTKISHWKVRAPAVSSCSSWHDAPLDGVSSTSLVAATCRSSKHFFGVAELLKGPSVCVCVCVGLIKLRDIFHAQRFGVKTNIGLTKWNGKRV